MGRENDLFPCVTDEHIWWFNKFLERVSSIGADFYRLLYDKSEPNVLQLTCNPLHRTFVPPNFFNRFHTELFFEHFSRTPDLFKGIKVWPIRAMFEPYDICRVSEVDGNIQIAACWNNSTLTYRDRECKTVRDWYQLYMMLRTR